jgi:hypothetical protein
MRIQVGYSNQDFAYGRCRRLEGEGHPVRRIVDVRPTERKRRAVEPDLPEPDERPRPAHAAAAALSLANADG